MRWPRVCCMLRAHTTNPTNKREETESRNGDRAPKKLKSILFRFQNIWEKIMGVDFVEIYNSENYQYKIIIMFSLHKNN